MTQVVHISSVHYPFDARIFHKELRSLSESGYETTLIAHYDGSVKRDGIQVRSLGAVESRVERWSGLPRLFVAAREEDAEIYHFHDPELIPVGVLLALTTDAAVVYDVHEDYSDAILVREWIPDVIRPLLSRLFPLLQGWITRLLDLVVTADDSVADQLRSQTSTPVISLRNLPRIDDIKVEVGDVERSHEHILAYVGGLDRERGLMEMLNVTARLRHSGYDVGLWLLGPFQDDELEREARSFIAHEDITDHVRLFGYVDYSEIFGYLTHADIGLLLADEARFKRNVPTKFFEYMYSGLPVVSTAIPSLAEFRSPEYCITVSEGKIEQTTETISELLDDPGRIREMGEAGQEKIETEYNWELEQKKLLLAYENLMSGK